MKAEAIKHQKMYMLASAMYDRLASESMGVLHPMVRQLCVAAAIGAMEGIWTEAGNYAPDGNLASINPMVVAGWANWTDDPAWLIEALIRAEFVDRLEGGRVLYLHNWHEHCRDKVHMKLARAGALFANGARPKTTRLSGSERERVEKALDEAERAWKTRGKSRKKPQQARAHGVHTEHARQAHGVCTGVAPLRHRPGTAPAPAPARAQGGDPGTPCADGDSGEHTPNHAPPDGAAPELLVDGDPIRPEESGEPPGLREAIAAMDRWSRRDRKHALVPSRNEHTKVANVLRVLHAGPAVIRGGRLIPAPLLVGEAVEVLMAKGDLPFKSIEFALGCVRNEIGDWRATGPPGEPRSESTRAGKSNAQIVQEVFGEGG